MERTAAFADLASAPPDIPISSNGALHSSDGALHSSNGALHSSNGALHSSNGALHSSNGAIRISVVVPTLNEARNLPHVISRLPDDIYELVLVDGGSADDTVEVARSLHPRMRLVEQSRSGKGNALACGFAAAGGDVIIALDADGSTDPAEIPRFVEALQRGADYAKGSRFTTGGGSDDITGLRNAGNWALTRLVNLLFGTNYSDLCYGYNAFRTDVRHCIGGDIDGFEIETAMNIRVAKAGLSVVEVPSSESSRLHGASNLRTFRDGWRVLKTILSERFSKPAQGGSLNDALHAQLGHPKQAARTPAGLLALQLPQRQANAN